MVIFLGQWDGNVFFRKKYWYQWFFGGESPLPFNIFQPTDHCFQWFSNGFGVTKPSPLNDFQPPDHWFQWFLMVLGSFNYWFQWFSMVMDHWSNDAMVSMDC